LRHRNSCFGIGTAILLTWLVACNGGGRSPTDPTPRLPSIAGSWTGSWSVGNIGVRSTMDLVQDQNGRVTGTMGILGDARSIEGSVTQTRFSWHLANPANCPSFAGDLDLVFAQGWVIEMSGMATQDARACLPNGTETSGLMSLSRSGS
jgi:hypothetical protein